MNKPLKVLTLIAAMGVSGAANAALVSRLGGQAVYDTDLNVTWLADANYARTSGYDADGLMTWSQAMTWASNLSYGGYTDWRLPTTAQPDPTCSNQFNWTGGVVSSGYNCTGSEMGHLFYTELGVTAGSSIFSSTDLDLALFTNVQSTSYWSSTEYARDTNSAWIFAVYNGSQGALNKGFNYYYAWAVHSGDIATVPVPAAAWLFGSGLFGLVGIARRKARGMTTD